MASTTVDGLVRRPISVTEYELLGRQGAFADETVELLDGDIVLVADEGPSHADVASRLARILFDAIPGDVGDVRVGHPIGLGDRSMPEPDLYVTVPHTSYRAHHPRTASFLIEVSVTSRPIDVGVKARIYAAARIPEYWVVDVPGRRIIVHTDPEDGEWGRVEVHRDGVLRPRRHPSVVVDVLALLG